MKKVIERDEPMSVKHIPDENFIWGKGWSEADISEIKRWVREPLERSHLSNFGTITDTLIKK